MAKKETTEIASSQPDRAAPKKLVLSLIRKSNETKTRMQSISGELGVEVKEAIENKHLNARALKLIARLSRLDPDKRVAELAAFDLYRTYAEEGGLFGAPHVGDLVEDAERGSPVDISAPNIGDAEGTYARTN